MMKVYRNSEQTARTVESLHFFIYYKFIYKVMTMLYNSFLFDTLVKAISVSFFNIIFTVIFGYIKFSFF
jgi:hypothetical protein